MLKIYNTLSHKIEEFKPINPPIVGMYSCGPTVYDYPHIGNLRTFVFSDILLRVLKSDGFDVIAVQNITDIEDKIIKKAKEQNITIEQVTKKYYDVFVNDIQQLNIPLKAPKYQPKATEYIEEMIKYIKTLID